MMMNEQKQHTNAAASSPSRDRVTDAMMADCCEWARWASFIQRLSARRDDWRLQPQRPLLAFPGQRVGGLARQVVSAS